MSGVAVVTDTVANLPPDVCREYGIRVVPQIVIFGDESFREGVDLSVEAFYRRLRQADPLPITSRPTLQSYAEVFQEAAREAASVLVLTPSRHLSGAFEAAATAARDFAGRVRIVDTRTAALAQGLIVTEAARLARQEADPDRLAGHVEALRPRVMLYGAIPTLRYLQRTGRVGRAAAAMGSLLQIKPIITIGEDGVVDSADRVRSWGRALERLAELVEAARPDPGAALHLGVMHADAEPDARALLQRLSERFAPVEQYFTHLTPAVATHTGPGLVAVAFWWEPASPAGGRP